jgi:hypothetical protein
MHRRGVFCPRGATGISGIASSFQIGVLRGRLIACTKNPLDFRKNVWQMIGPNPSFVKKSTPR